jgi:heterodisulfide reductase subunit B
MNYLYYPGCSLKGTGRAYEESTLAVFRELEIPLDEIDDWNCCGATAYMAISELKAFALSARNLAIAEKRNGGGKTGGLIAPCAACYLVLNKTQKYLKEFPHIREKVNLSLKAAGLSYQGQVKIRHPLDVLVNDIGVKELSGRVKKPLKGLKIACYYGCQIVRPYAEFDDQFEPTSMDKIARALGAETVDWPLKTRCCGGSLSGTVQEVGMRLSYILLKEARRRGADAIATACPLCQFNLECYQSQIGRQFEDKINMPVVYFTQLIGRAFDIPGKKLGMQRLFVPLPEAAAGVSAEGAPHVAR